MKFWGSRRFLGRFLGIALRSGLFFHPGNGRLQRDNRGWIIAGLEGAVVLRGKRIGAGLSVSASPRQRVKYDVALKTDKYVLVVHRKTRAG